MYVCILCIWEYGGFIIIGIYKYMIYLYHIKLKPSGVSHQFRVIIHCGNRFCK